MIKVGQKVKFNPHSGMHSCGDIAPFNDTEGVVKYVNANNRWFSVEYGEHNIRIAFNFNDIGKNVRLC